MPFCANCGSSADGRFCPKCGSAIGGAAAPPPPPPGASYSAPPPPPPPPNYQQAGYQQPISAPGLTSNIASMLCYIIPVVCPIVFLVVDPYKTDRRIRFDAFQSLFLWVAFIILGIALTIVTGISYHLYFLHSIAQLAEFGITVLMAIKAYQGEKFVLPIIGPFAEKQA